MPPWPRIRSTRYLSTKISPIPTPASIDPGVTATALETSVLARRAQPRRASGGETRRPGCDLFANLPPRALARSTGESALDLVNLQDVGLHAGADRHRHRDQDVLARQRQVALDQGRLDAVDQLLGGGGGGDQDRCHPPEQREPPEADLVGCQTHDICIRAVLRDQPRGASG